MTTSVGICVLNRFFSQQNVKSWRSVFFVILTTMSNTFIHLVDRSVLIFFGFKFFENRLLPDNTRHLLIATFLSDVRCR